MPYQPIVNGKASICHWDLTFSFHTKEQCVKFIKGYFKLPYPLYLHYEEEDHDSFNRPLHTITITGCWANNLNEIAKILETCDYEEEK